MMLRHLQAVTLALGAFFHGCTDGKRSEVPSKAPASPASAFQKSDPNEEFRNLIQGYDLPPHAKEALDKALYAEEKIWNPKTGRIVKEPGTVSLERYQAQAIYHYKEALILLGPTHELGPFLETRIKLKEVFHQPLEEMNRNLGLTSKD